MTAMQPRLLRGVIIGDSQMKFLNRTRLYLGQNSEVCTFSFGGADAPRLTRKLPRMKFGPLDFVALHVGGNDLSNGKPVDDIARDIKLLVLEALKKAEKAFLFRVIPRQVEDTIMKRRRLGLGTLLEKMLPDRELVTLVNTEGRFAGKPLMHGADGYHVGRGLGIKALAKALSLAVRVHFRSVWQPWPAEQQLQVWRNWKCRKCNARGHLAPDCCLVSSCEFCNVCMTKLCQEDRAVPSTLSQDLQGVSMAHM